MAGFRSGLFLLGLSSSASQGGYVTPLPNWNAGAQTQEQGGFKTVLPFWGAGANDIEQAGFKTVLPFWAAGASIFEQAGFVTPLPNWNAGAHEVAGGASSLGLIDDEEVILISNLFMQYIQKVKK